VLRKLEISVVPYGRIGDQVLIESSARRSAIGFQPDAGDAHILTVQGSVMNPLPKIFVVSQSPANLQAEGAGVCIDKSRRDPSIASVPMDEIQARLSHFPRLLDDLSEHTIPDDLAWMVSV
jgi:hypothetical protein